MAAQIIAFAARLRPAPSRDWSSQELAEFYRVESALLQAGLELDTERGVSDEGDPWFVFCRVDTGEVFIHFARVDGQYVVDGAALGAPARGHDFGGLVRDLIGRHPLAHARRPGSNILLHPAALLIALVGAAFFQSGHAKAAEVSSPHAPKEEGRRALTVNVGAAAPPASTGETTRTIALDPSEAAAVLAGVAIGLQQVAASAAASAPGATTSAPEIARPLLAPDALPHAAPSSGFSLSGALAALGGAEARAALTVMAVFHDLARPVAAVASAAPDAAVSPVGVAVVVHTSAAPAEIAAPVGGGAAALAAPTMLLVHLASGPMPQIEALAIVAADGALSHVSSDRVVHVDQLPPLLVELLKGGDVVNPTPAAPTTPSDDTGAASGGSSTGGDHPTLPSLVHTGPTDGLGTGGGGGTGGGSGGGSPPSGPAPPSGGGGDPPHGGTVDPAPPSALTPDAPADKPAVVDTAPVTIPPPAHVATGHSAQIDAAILDFVSKVTDVGVIVSGHEVVLYDPHILQFLAPGEVLDSITFKLEDGSSISLIGTVTELHAYHGLS